MARPPESDDVYTEGLRNFARNKLRLPASFLEFADFLGRDRHTTTRRIEKLVSNTGDVEYRFLELGRRSGVYRAVIVDGRLVTDAGFIPLVSLRTEGEEVEYDCYTPEALAALPNARLVQLIKTVGEVLTERTAEL